MENHFYRTLIDTFRKLELHETLKRQTSCLFFTRYVFDQNHFDVASDENQKLDSAKAWAQKLVDKHRSKLSSEDLTALGFPVCLFCDSCEPGNTGNECSWHVDNTNVKTSRAKLHFCFAILLSGSSGENVKQNFSTSISSTVKHVFTSIKACIDLK